METTIFLLTLSVLMVGIIYLIYKFYSMKRTYLKAGKCIVQLIDKVWKLETENKDLQDWSKSLLSDLNNTVLIEPLKRAKVSKKKSNTKIGQKTKQAKIKQK